MRKKQIDSMQAEVQDFVTDPIKNGSNLDSLYREKEDIEYHIWMACHYHKKLGDSFFPLFVGLLRKKSFVSFLISRLLFPEHAEDTEEDRVKFFLGTVYSPLSLKRRRIEAFEKMMEKVLAKLWPIIEGDIYQIKSITFLDRGGLCMFLCPDFKLALYGLVFPGSILKEKKDEALKTISHEIAHILQPRNLEMDKEVFAKNLTRWLIAEIELKGEIA